MTDRKKHSSLSQVDYQEWLQAIKDVKKLKKVKSKVDISRKPIAALNIMDDIKPIFKPNIKPVNIILGEKGNLSKKLIRQMDQGKMSIDAKIDLHGLTESESIDKFCQFIENSYARGCRLVLVITGKGSTFRPAIIKNRLPTWINSERLAPYILRFTLANTKHGGLGAFYIYLRKSTV